MKKFEVLIFDLDDTLLDFSYSEKQALPYAMNLHGVTISEKDFAEYKKINRACWKDMEKGLLSKDTCVVLRFEKFFKKLGLSNLSAEQVNEVYLESLSRFTKPIEGAKELLESIKDDYKLVIITNGVKKVQDSKIARSGFDQYFNTVIVSDDAGFNKPDIRIFEHMEKLIGHYDKEKILMIGDSLESDIKGGKCFGIKTCLFDRTQEVEESIADYKVDKLSDILKILES